MKEILRSILNTGIKPDAEHFPAFIIYSLNFIALFGATGALLSILVVGTNHELTFYIPIALSLLLFVSILLFNYRGQISLAKFSLFGLFPLVQFCNVMLVDTSNIGITLTLLPLLLVSPLGIDRKELRIITICYLTILCFYPLKEHIYKLGIPFLFNVIIVVSVLLIGIYIILGYFRKYAKNIVDQNDTLSKQNKKLQNLIEQNDHKTELLAILSHDLKGPAASFDDLSKKVAFMIKHKRYDDLQEFGDYLEVAGDKIFRNIDRLLNWAISQKKEFITQVDTISPYELVNEISQKLELLNPNKKIYFDNNIPEYLQLKTDVRILEIILHNLLSNAWNNSPAEESVIIRSESSETEFITAMTNQGPAMDMDIINQVKAGRFHRSKRGHGLGLGICFSLIKYLKGDISYESIGNNDTTVRVSIPY